MGLWLSWSLMMVLSNFVLKHLHSSDLSPLQFVVLCGSELCSLRNVSQFFLFCQNWIFLHGFSNVVKQLKTNRGETCSNHWNCFSQLPAYKPSSVLPKKKGFWFVADSSMKMFSILRAWNSPSQNISASKKSHIIDSLSSRKHWMWMYCKQHVRSFVIIRSC